MKILSYVSIICFAAIIFIACKKDNSITFPVNANLSEKAKVQYYNASINSSRNYVYVDGKPVNGAAITYAAPLFPASAYGFAVDPGMHYVVLRDTLTATTQPWVTYTQTFDAGKHYTIFAYDTVNKAKYMIVPTNIEVPADTTSRVRFAHLSHSHTPVPAVDVYSVKRQANVWSNVSFATVTEFTPFASALNDTLHIRQAGTTTNLVSLNGIFPTRQRSYTVVFRGRYMETGTGATARSVSSFANY
jgi:hypothetical protein